MENNDVKDRIIDVAARLFMERGYAATSVREIGDGAGVGQSSLYHHIGSKGEILIELHRSFIDDLLARMHEAEARDVPTREKVREIIRIVLHTVEQHQARVTVFLREGHALAAEDQRDIQKSRDDVDQILDRILQQGIDRGELRPDIDVRLTRLAIYGMCNWSYQWFRRGGPQSSDEIAGVFADILFRGITAD